MKKLKIIAHSALSAFAVGADKAAALISIAAIPKSTINPNSPTMANLINEEFLNM